MYARLKHLAIVCTLLVSSCVIAQNKAETILTNAIIYGHDNADSIAIYNGKITAIGLIQDLETQIGRDTEVIDLDEAFILPGFVDNHNHVFEAASEIGGDCELDPQGSLNDQIALLRSCRNSTSENSWIIGYGFSLDAIYSNDNSVTPLEVIDQIFPRQPVIFMEQTSHSMWVNSVALEIAGITVDSTSPQGGRILIDEDNGELAGILLDNAGDIVMEMAWNAIQDKSEQSYQGLLNGIEEASAHGITTIGDGRLYWKRGWLDTWKKAQQNDELIVRVSLRPWIYPNDDIQDQLKYLASFYSDDLSQTLIINQVKMYSDGIFINGTAKTLAPYLDSYLVNDPRGINYIPPDQLASWLQALDDIGYGAHIHAIGDGAVKESLDAIALMRQASSTRQYTLTHVELVDRSDVTRFAQLNVTADFQVGSDYVANQDHSWAKAFLGARRAKAMMNIREMHDSGANISLSSDWNVHDINPLVGIANSLIMDESGLPNIYEAIDAYTINPAKSLGLDHLVGSIDVGKAADFAILDNDITKLLPSEIKNTQVLMTMFLGEIVFDSADK